MNNIHNYLHNLSTVSPATPMVLIDGQPTLLASPNLSLSFKLKNLSKKIVEDSAVVLSTLKNHIDRNFEELDGRDFAALNSITQYFLQQPVPAENVAWLENLSRSFATLNAPLAAEAQPALASHVPYHIETGYRVRIANQTKLISKGIESEALMQKGTLVAGGEDEDSLKSLLSKMESSLKSSKKRRTRFSVVNKDCLLAASEYQTRPNVTLLNMANANGPGGGWIIGDRAQEEELFRRTNYHRGLDPEYNAHMREQLKDGKYRIPFYGAIFTPSVTVLRDTENQLLPEDQRFQVNMLASAAVDLRPYPKNKELELCGGENFDLHKVAHYTKQKIRAQLVVAYLNNTEILILGAFGCGAFRHDPTLVANCYSEVLAEPLFKYAFKEIVFAIIDSGDTQNYSKFFEVLSRTLVRS